MGGTKDIMGKLKFVQVGPDLGDATANYDVEVDKECRTLFEFVAVVLLEKQNEWGTIYPLKDDMSWLGAHGIEYSHGAITNNPNRLEEKYEGWVIDRVTANGGWSSMDYYVHLIKADDEATKEPAENERRDNEEEKGGETMAKGKIVNALIEKVSLSMEDHGVLCYYLTLKMNGMGCNYGGRVIGKGYLGAKDFEGYAKGTEAIMRIMDVVGVHRWEDLKGKYVRVDLPDCGGSVARIGNIIEDKWFDQKEFFQDA